MESFELDGVRVHPHKVMQLINEQGPMTAGEIKFAYSWPSDAFALQVLERVDILTSGLNEVAGYWTVVVDYAGPQSK